jgi:TetR/AcrR family transcriptional regulator, cholesterol catabolism regulator
MILEKHFDTLSKMFFEEGIKSFTMDIICRRLGIAKKTLYKDFANKKELVNALFHEDLKQFRRELLRKVNDGSDAIQQLCVFFDLLSRRQNSISYATLSDLSEYYPELKYEIIGIENRLIIEVANSILMQGIAEKNFREDIVSERIGGIFSFHYISGIILRSNQIHQNQFSFADTGLLDFHFRSIATAAGLELWNSRMANLVNSL